MSMVSNAFIIRTWRKWVSFVKFFYWLEILKSSKASEKFTN